MPFLRKSIKHIGAIGFIFSFFFSALAAEEAVLRVVTVPVRETAERILSRLESETPLAIGTKGVASVETLSSGQVKRLPPSVQEIVADLLAGKHSGIFRTDLGFSIYQKTTFKFFREAWRHYQNGDGKDALAKVEQHLILNPDHEKGLALIGKLYEDEGQYRRAAEAYQQLIGFHPKDALGYRLIGRVYELEKKWNLAAENYEEALKRDSKQHDVLNNLSLIYANRLGDPQKGISLIERAVKLSPKTPEYLDTLAEIQEEVGRGDEAAETRKEAKRMAAAESAATKKAGGLKAKKRLAQAVDLPASQSAKRLPAPPQGVVESPWPPPQGESKKAEDSSSAGDWPPANGEPKRKMVVSPKSEESPKGWPTPSLLPPPTAPMKQVRATIPIPPTLVSPPIWEEAGGAQLVMRIGFKSSAQRELFVMSPSMREKEWPIGRTDMRGLHLQKPEAAKETTIARISVPPIGIKILDGAEDLAGVLLVQNLLQKKGFEAKQAGTSKVGWPNGMVLYFKEGFERQADQVASALPGNLEIRFLTWETPFNIVLVVGNSNLAK